MEWTLLNQRVNYHYAECQDTLTVTMNDPKYSRMAAHKKGGCYQPRVPRRSVLLSTQISRWATKNEGQAIAVQNHDNENGAHPKNTEATI